MESDRQAVTDDVSLFGRLGATDPEQRRRAVETLVAQGPAALPLLYRVLRGGGLLARHAALEAVERLGRPEAASAVEPLLHEPELREHAAEVLLLLAAGSRLDVLMLRASGGDVAALRALTSSPLLGRFDRLRQVIEDHARPHQEPGWPLLPLEEAMDALGIPGENRAVPALREALAIRSPPVQVAAARALGRVGTPEAAEALGQAPWPAAGEALEARVKTLAALGEAGAAALVRGLEQCSGPHVPAAEAALAQLGPAAVPALCDFIAAGHTVGCSHAIELLGRLRDRRAVPVLIALARGDATPWHRTLACAALAKLGDSEAAPALREALRARSHSLRAAAAAALVDLGDADPGLIPFLNGGLHSGAAAVRQNSARALGLLAERAPDIHLRSALPRLGWLGASWLPRQEERRVFREALERIETATEARRRMPLPASSPTTDLPLPSGPPSTREVDGGV